MYLENKQTYRTGQESKSIGRDNTSDIETCHTSNKTNINIYE